MAGSRRMILKHVTSDICTKMNRTKSIPTDIMETPLNRCLNTFDITLLGVGHMVGAGIYVLTGTVAKDIAGPGIILSFLLAGFACLLSALCYAEFGTRIPKAGSAYIYTYISLGEFWAFVIGWNILLEHMIGAASVARAWSGYVDSLFNNYISNTTHHLTGDMHQQLLAKYPDFLAFFICIIYSLLLAIGVKCSAIINSILTIINLTVMTLIIVIGLSYADQSNWIKNTDGFLPYGISGVITGAATCFYAFVGFDSIATSSEEAKNPKYTIPIATIISMGIVTLGYVLVSAALTLIIPYDQIDVNAALPEAFGRLGLNWCKYAVSVGAICGMTTTLFGSLFSLPRSMYAMASDGLLFECLADINLKTKLPFRNLIISGLSSAIIALLFDLEKLVEFMSIGTLLAYTIVSASIIILRYTPNEINSKSMITTSETSLIDDGQIVGTLRPEYKCLSTIFGYCRPGTVVKICVSIYAIASVCLCVFLQCDHYAIWWCMMIIVGLVILMCGCLIVIYGHYQNDDHLLGFRVPFVPYVPALSILFNIEFMVHLNILTWLRFFVWMVIGMLVYFLYGIHHSKEGGGVGGGVGVGGGGGGPYSILMETSEAVKENWGATIRTKNSINKLSDDDDDDSD